MKKESFIELFGVSPKDMHKDPKSPWIFLKKKNRWVNANIKIYTEEDQLQLKSLIKSESISSTSSIK